MAVVGRTGFGPRTIAISVSGGGAFSSHVRRERATAQARLAAQFVARFPMDRLKAKIPARTGRLRASLKLRQRGGVVWLTGAFYGPFAQFRTGGTVASHFNELAKETLRTMGAIS